MQASAFLTSVSPRNFASRPNIATISPRTEHSTGGGESSERHVAAKCATSVSHSGVPAMSSCVRLSKAASTAFICSLVKLRPCIRSRWRTTPSGSSMSSTLEKHAASFLRELSSRE
eukprot:2094038-Rhodomonas_salina.2